MLEAIGGDLRRARVHFHRDFQAPRGGAQVIALGFDQQGRLAVAQSRDRLAAGRKPQRPRRLVLSQEKEPVGRLGGLEELVPVAVLFDLRGERRMPWGLATRTWTGEALPITRSGASNVTTVSEESANSSNGIARTTASRTHRAIFMFIIS